MEEIRELKAEIVQIKKTQELVSDKDVKHLQKKSKNS